MTEVKITEDKFEQYQSVRNSGMTNMFDVKQVINLSDDLTREEVLNIMSNYATYEKQYQKGGESNEDNS